MKSLEERKERRRLRKQPVAEYAQAELTEEQQAELDKVAEAAKQADAIRAASSTTGKPKAEKATKATAPQKADPGQLW